MSFKTESFLLAGEKALLDGAWIYQRQRQTGNVVIMMYKNTIIRMMYKCTQMQISPPMAGGSIWVDIGQAGHALNPVNFNNYIEGVGAFGISPSVQGMILSWRKVPEEEEEEEETPEEVIDDGLGIIDQAVGNVRDWIKDVVTASLAFLEGPLQLIRDLISKVGSMISTFKDALEAALTSIIAQVVAWFEQIVGKIKEVYDRVFEVLQTVYLTVKDAVENIIEGIVSAITVVVQWIRGTFTDLWKKMKSGLKFIGEGIVNGIKFLWEKIKDGLDWVGQVLNSAYKALKDVIAALWDRTKDTFHKVIEKIVEGFSVAMDRVMEFFAWYADAWREEQRVNIAWTEEKLIEFMTWTVKAQKKVIEKLAKEGVRA